jgi:hypothetical protein
LAAVDQVCSATGDDAAILVVPYASLGMILPQTLRGFCGVPVAKPRAPEAVDVYELARAWQEQGRRLFIIGASTDAVLSVAPDASPVVTVVVDDRYAPEKTRDGAPRERSPQPVEVHVYTVRG